MRKKILPGLIIVLVLMIMVSGCTKKRKVGVLDMKQVLNNSNRAQQLKKELSDIGDNLEQEYSQKEKNLKGEEKDKELDLIYQQFLNNKKDYEKKLNLEINKVLSDISKSQNLDVVLLKKYIQYGGTDITDKTIRKLDEKFYNKGGAKSNEKEAVQE